MKRIIIILFALLPMLMQAGVIMKRSGERLEDVTIKSVTDSEIVYELNGQEIIVAKTDVSAILYDDGRYEEIRNTMPISSESIGTNSKIKEEVYVPTEAGPGAKEYNVYAYGVYAVMGYFSNSEYDDATVEYRVIYKSQQGESDFRYLGTSPFAYVTNKMFENPLVGKGNPYLVNLMQPRPLVIEDAKNISKIEFRLSKEGYKTVVVKPIQDVLIGCGPLLMIPMNKLRPLKPGETNEELNTLVKSKNSTAQSASNNQELETRLQAQEQERLIREEQKRAKEAEADAARQAEQEKRLAQAEARRLENEHKKIEREAAKAAAIEQARLEKEQERLEKERAEQEYKERSKYFITKAGSNEYIYLNNTMDRKAYQAFLRNNCPAAYAKYKKGTREVQAGWSLFTIGIAAAALGWTMAIAPDIFPESGSFDYKTYANLGIISGSVSVCVSFVGLCTFSAGYSHRNKALKLYNNSCAGPQEHSLSLNFGPTRNGLGLTLNF